MSPKKRGRPLSPSKQHLSILQSPPPYILQRVQNRRKEIRSIWTPVVESMDEYHTQLRAYGRKFRIKIDDVWTILCIEMHEAQSTSADEAIAKAQQSWKRMSEAGLRARGYKTPEWHALARELILNSSYTHHTERGLASIVRAKCADKKPDERTIRRFFEKVKKSGAYLS